MNRWTENAMTYKTLHKKFKIGEHEPQKNRRCSGMDVNYRNRRKSHTKNREDEPMCPGRVSCPCYTSVTVKRHEHHMIWKSCWTPAYNNKFN